VKSSGVWEATQQFTSGLPPGDMLNGKFSHTFPYAHTFISEKHDDPGYSKIRHLIPDFS
jgi:hypothetical protein